MIGGRGALPAGQDWMLQDENRLDGPTQSDPWGQVRLSVNTPPPQGREQRSSPGKEK